jgi:hypothetical protein
LAGTLRVSGNRFERRIRGLGFETKYYNAEITVLVSLSLHSAKELVR